MISVILCTRDRGDRVLSTVRSILRNAYPRYEILIVDQSRDPIGKLLGDLLEDSRIRYYSVSEVGLSRGRNFGVSMSRGDIVACTDDDCEVFEDWMDRLTASFDMDERIQIVFGSVYAAEIEKERRSMIPHYLVPKIFVAKTMDDKARVHGMGACMAFRRKVWIKLSGFDPFLGAGTLLPSAEENDFAFRALDAGFWVLETPLARVRHYGDPPGGDPNRRIAGYMLGTGAMFAKHLRLGAPGTVSLILRVFFNWVFHRSPIQYASRPKRLVRLVWFIRGMYRGMAMPLDKRSGHFMDRS